LNWWIVLIRGFWGILFSMVVFLWPGMTLTALIVVYGVYAMVDGWIAMAIGFGGDADGASWWQMVVAGITSTSAGILTFLWPGITAAALLTIIATWSMVRGAADIAAAIRIRTPVQTEWLLIASGVCSVSFSAILFARPGAGALAAIWTIGCSAVVLGVLAMAQAFKLRSLNINPLGLINSAIAAAKTVSR
jgi:uncharacterized membrane protein HdeD (DUF308 family)